MAPFTRSSAHLAVVDAIAQGNHRCCRSLGNRQFAGCIDARVCVRSLGRLCGGFHRFMDGGTGARAWSCRRGAVDSTHIHNPIDPAAYVVGYIECPIRAHGKSGRTMCGAGGILVGARETVGENLASARRAFTLKRLENHVVALLRVWRAIPRAMKGDEDSVAIAGWKFVLVVTHHGVRRPMGGKGGNRSNLARANTHLFAAIAAVFGRKNELSLHTVVIAFGPAIVAAGLQEQQLLSR